MSSAQSRAGAPSRPAPGRTDFQPPAVALQLFQPARIRAVAAGIWAAMCGEELVPDDASTVGEPMLTGYVAISGAWDGQVQLRLSRDLADALTSRILGAPAPDTEAVLDAVGELCNMLAGNLKALVAGPARISLPVVVAGPPGYDHRPGTTVVMGCLGQVLAVSVLDGPAPRPGPDPARGPEPGDPAGPVPGPRGTP